MRITLLALRQGTECKMANTVRAIGQFTVIRQEVNAGTTTITTFIFNITLAVTFAFGDPCTAANTTFIFRITLAVALFFRDICRLGAVAGQGVQ